MITSVVDLCTTVSVLVDDLYRGHFAPFDRRPGPRAVCSESEILTLSLVSELIGMDEEVAFLAYVRRNHPTLFPHVPERSRYNRRCRALCAVANALRRAIQRRVWADLPADERDLCVIDSLSVPVVGFAHACGRLRRRGIAAYGDNATKKQTICGLAWLRTSKTRRGNHARGDDNPAIVGLLFEVICRTDDLAERCGLEQLVYDQYPNALLNRQRPHWPS